MRRNLQPDIGVPGADFARHLRGAAHFPDDPESLGVDEAIEQLATLHGAVFVENNHRHMFDVVVERVAKSDHLDERREEHEKERHRVAQDDDELLKKDGAKAAEGAFHYLPGCSNLSSRAA